MQTTRMMLVKHQYVEWLQHHAAGEVVLDQQDQRQPDAKTGCAKDQGLLHDQPDDGAVGRADQFKRGDLFQLLHRHRVDDERDHHRAD